MALNPNDLEQNSLKQQLLCSLQHGDVPDLLSLTKIAHAVILEELERMIHLTVDITRSDYGVFIGIQIHTPESRHFVWPRAAYAVMGENRLNLPCAE